MFYNVHFTICSTVCQSDFLGVPVQLTHIFFSTLCVSHFLFFSATQKRTVIYNMHLTPCSTVCLSDFLGVSVQLTHIFFLQCAFLIFCFSVQLINILCFTISIWHHVLQCACLIFLVFQCNSLIYWVLHCAFPIFCFSVQLINILCVTMGISHYVLLCAGLIF